MNSLNLDNISSMSLEDKDSEVQNMRFADFVKKYKHCCEAENVVGPKLEEDKDKSEVSSPDELSIKTSSLTSIEPVPTTSQAEPVVDCAGFNRFMDEWTKKVTVEAKKKWKKMNRNQRALYAPRDDLGDLSVKRLFVGDVSSSTIIRACDEFVGQVSSSTIRQACEEVCSTLIRSRICKRKGPQYKKGIKTKGVGKASKPLGAKSCPNVKSGKKGKKGRNSKESATKGDKKIPTPKSAFPKFLTRHF